MIPGTGAEGGDPPPAAGGERVPEPRVLVVDDNAASHHLAVRILESGGYRGVAVSSAPEARRELAAHAFDVILIDVRMPGESGLDLLHAVRTTYPRIIPIMLTASVEPEVREQALRLGASSFILKPYGVTELLACVEEALRAGPIEGSGSGPPPERP